MSKTQLYIGTDLLDFDDEINIKRQVNDYRNTDIGASNKSYTLAIQLTRTNQIILKQVADVRSRQEVSETARLISNGMEVIRGKFRILSVAGEEVRAIIEGDDWLDGITGISIRDLSWAGGDAHTFTSANILASWVAAAGALYRYPLINFSELISGEYGVAGSAVYPYDFYPAWHIETIVTKMLLDAGYTLAGSGFFASALAQSLYLLSAPVPASDDFITGKAMSVYVDTDTDNYDLDNVAGGGTGGPYINAVVMDIDAETTDEGSDFNVTTNRYVIPEAGVYRFKVTMTVYSTQNVGDGGNWTVTSNQLSWALRKNGTAFETKTASGNDTFDTGNQFTIDSGYLYLEAADYIDVLLTTIRSVATNNTGGALDAVIYVVPGAAISFFEAIWSEQNLWPGIGQTIGPNTHLPDMDAIDLLAGLKRAFNLRFFMDRINKTLYIETADDFYGSTVVDWSDKIDYSAGIDMEIISSNYTTTHKLYYRPESSDKAYINEVAASGVPFEKVVTLTSEYKKPGITEHENPTFSPTPVGDMPQVGHWAYKKVPRIFGGAAFVSSSQPYPANRPKSWLPRLLQWAGMVAFTAGNFNYYEDIEDTSASNYTTFPSMVTPDMNDNYDNYWLKDWRRINGNKIVTVTLRLTPSDIIKFSTVVGTAANEGFRATYLLNIEGVDMYFICSKIITDGDRVQGEFIQKM